MPLDQLHETERINTEKGEMSFFEHIEELRQVLVRSAVAIIAIGAVFFLNKDFLFQTILLGPVKPDFPTYTGLCRLSHAVGMGESMCFAPTPVVLQGIGIGEVLMQHLYISFWLGVVCAFPYVFWQVWRFIQPGLLDNEQKAVRGVVGICSFLFIFGVLFGYFVIAPFSINFLAGYTVEGIEVKPRLDSYVTYMTMFTIPIGLIFEMPIVAYFLAKIGVLGQQFMRSYRRHAVVAVFIIAAIITPPDVVSQTLVAIPLLVLYEASILIVGRVEKKRTLELDQAEKNALTIHKETGD